MAISAAAGCRTIPQPRRDRAPFPRVGPGQDIRPDARAKLTYVERPASDQEWQSTGLVEPLWHGQTCRRIVYGQFDLSLFIHSVRRLWRDKFRGFDRGQHV